VSGTGVSWNVCTITKSSSSLKLTKRGKKRKYGKEWRKKERNGRGDITLNLLKIFLSTFKCLHNNTMNNYIAIIKFPYVKWTNSQKDMNYHKYNEKKITQIDL
jgi:hypothetical protein